MSNRFSVIIRCKNEERWIGHALQSVIDLVPNNEIIIVDNNSVDKSLEIIRQFKANPNLELNNNKYTDIKLINVDDYTPGLALNEGVKVASNPVILILSSHCVLKKFDEERILKDLESYVAIFGNQDPIYQGQRITKRYLWSHFGSEKKEDMYSDSEGRYFFHNALSIIRRDVLENHPFDEDLAGKEDRYWASMIIENNIGKILYDPTLSCDHHYTDAGNTWKGVG
jgi:glycosyltransferase involved in cell wall biosynthesis